MELEAIVNRLCDKKHLVKEKTIIVQNAKEEEAACFIHIVINNFLLRFWVFSNLQHSCIWNIFHCSFISVLIAKNDFGSRPSPL